MIGNTNTINQEIVFSKIYQSAGGDGSYSSYIPFNTVDINIGGGTWENGLYTVPKDGIYMAIFTNFSNSMGSGRATVFHLNSTNTVLDSEFNNANYSCSLTGIFSCSAGDKLAAGGLNSSYTISIYRAKGHNCFTIIRLA